MSHVAEGRMLPVGRAPRARALGPEHAWRIEGGKKAIVTGAEGARNGAEAREVSRAPGRITDF